MDFFKGQITKKDRKSGSSKVNGVEEVVRLRVVNRVVCFNEHVDEGRIGTLRNHDGDADDNVD